MLTKQSIRRTIQIYMNTLLIEDKEVIIKESENWNESQEILFKKMLQQGGNFSIGDHKFRIITPIKDNL
jgi:hypothetical protein|tara:strand:+ start:407 stop:613 length:207 start_codon:yes stop_codon:yes gene_type:complete